MGTHGGERGWPDDDDYNNRDFRGLEIAARAFARPDIQSARDFSYELRYDQRYGKLFPGE